MSISAGSTGVISACVENIFSEDVVDHTGGLITEQSASVGVASVVEALHSRPGAGG